MPISPMACSWPSSQSMWCSSSTRIFSSSSREPASFFSVAELDALVQAFHGVVLQLHIVLELLLHALTDVDLEVVGHVRCAVEIEDALHQFFGVRHLFDRLFANQFRQPLVSPVLAHLRVQKVLVDRRKLGFQHLVQQRNNLCITLHEDSSVWERLLAARKKERIVPIARNSSRIGRT